MVFGAFVGTVGTGKTLGMVQKAYQYYKKGHAIYSNIHLRFPHTYIESIEDLDKIRGDLNKPAILLLDEIWRWLDSRCFKGKKNDVITKIIMYSRKRGFSIFYTTQRFHQVEKRIRDVTDAYIEPELSAEHVVLFQGKKQRVPLVCVLKYFSVTPKSTGSGNKVSNKVIKFEKFPTLPIMNLYDTKEEIQVIE